MDLESLSNKELRAKCLQYGLPDVPVTDSSRKLLLRRLQKALDPNADKKGNPSSKRRETVSASIESKQDKTKHSTTNVSISVKEPQKAKSNKKRHTLAAPISIESDEVEVNLRTTTDNRHVNKNTNNNSQSHLAQTLTTHDFYGTNGPNDNFSKVFSSPFGAHNGYDSTTSPIERTFANSTFLSQPLQRSQQKEINYARAPITRIVPIDRESMATAATTKTQKPSNQLYPDLSSMQAAPAIASEPPPRYRRSPSLSKSEVLTTSYRQEVTPVKVVHYEKQEEEYNEAEDGDAELDSGYVIDKQPHKYNNNYRFSAGPPSLAAATQPIYSNSSYGIIGSSKLSSVPVRSYATSIPSTSSHKQPPPQRKQKPHVIEEPMEIDDDRSESSDDGGRMETPYLSKFAHKLETLRAEPLDLNAGGELKRRLRIGTGGGASSPLLAAERSRRFERGSGAAARSSGEDDVQVLDFWDALDRKYHIKQSLGIILAFLVAVFIYVIIFA